MAKIRLVADEHERGLRVVTDLSMPASDGGEAGGLGDVVYEQSTDGTSIVSVDLEFPDEGGVERAASALILDPKDVAEN